MKISVILSRFPYPLEKGDKLRIYHQIRLLQKEHQVQIIAVTESKPEPEHIQELEKISSEIHFYPLQKSNQIWQLFQAFFKGLPLQLGYFFQPQLFKDLPKLLKEFGTETAYFQLPRTAPYARDLKIRKVIDYQDTFSQGMYRQYKKSNLLLKPLLWMEYKRMQRYEAKILDRFDASTIISEQDRELIQHPKRDQIKIVRNGVDFEFFHPNPRIEKSFDLVFVGNMSYPPNILAAEFLVNEILPKLKSEPKVLIAGANPHKRVEKLSSHQVVISGWLDDIREAYWKSKIFIAPMKIGTGLQNKLLEAMSIGLPCITTPLANNALQAPKSSISIGESSDELAQAIEKLLQNPNQIKHQGELGRKFVHQEFSWEAAIKPLNEILQG